MAWEVVIGLECHIQVRSQSKMFCDCPAEFGAPPNSNVCPVCLGLPGALPRANRAGLDAALSLGLALGSTIRERSVFARKHYFYPDMPKNYQITQYDLPICEGGSLPVVDAGGSRRAFGLTRIHIEEDTGKSFHPERVGDRRISRVDFNRAGVPLLELVTQPVLGSPEDCGAFLGGLRRLVRWLGISDGDMEKGQLRCDANVSLRPAGSSRLGTKTELKNLNSIRGVEKGLAAEIARQAGALDAGEPIVQATLLYDADHDKLAIMRTKEHAHDYRYFPDPDLPEVEVDPAWREGARAALPELPWEREARLVAAGLPAYDAAVLCETRALSDYFESLAAVVPAKLASNWVMTEMLRALKVRDESVEAWAARIPPARFGDLLRRLAAGELTGPNAKEVFEAMAETGEDPAAIVAARGFKVVAAADDLLPVIRAVLDENAGPVAQVLAGKTSTFGFLVGQVMKKTGGQAAPQVVQSLLRAEIEARARPGG